MALVRSSPSRLGRTARRAINVRSGRPGAPRSLAIVRLVVQLHLPAGSSASVTRAVITHRLVSDSQCALPVPRSGRGRSESSAHGRGTVEFEILQEVLLWDDSWFSLPTRSWRYPSVHLAW